MRILVFGAGAIGGVTGGYLTQAGEDVLLVDRVTDHVQAMQERGLLIDGVPGQLVVPVKAATPDVITGTFDVVLLTVKSQHTAAALATLVPFVAADGVVLSMQNGLGNKALVAEQVGAHRSVGVMVRFGCAYRGPGHVTHLTPGLFKVGELDGRMTTRLEALRQLLDKVAPTSNTDNIYGWLWAKQTYGCLLEITALVDATITEVLLLPGAEELMTQAMRECVRVALAEGVRLEAFDFLDPNALIGSSPADDARRRQDIETIKARFGHTKTGVWRDIAVRHIPTEVPYTAGEVVRRGDRAGVPTPILKRSVEMIAELERSERQMSPDNLVELAQSVESRTS